KKESDLPGLGISIFSALLPVILLTITTISAGFVTSDGLLKGIISFLGDPAIVMILSLMLATYSLGLRMNIPLNKVLGIYGEALKDIAMLLLIMSGAGALKEMLGGSGASEEIGLLLNGLDIHPLVLGWFITCVSRVCVGSATVAGLTAASLILPLMARGDIDPSLMVLSIGA